MLLKKAPILFSFLEGIFGFSSYLKDKTYFLNELKILDRCHCGEKDCATVYMKNKKDWDKNLLGCHECINTNKGIIILHFQEHGLFELEALQYEKFPYRNEVVKILKKETSFVVSERDELQSYFKGLCTEDMQTILLD
jgi:hypothetical protein